MQGIMNKRARMTSPALVSAAGAWYPLSMLLSEVRGQNAAVRTLSRAVTEGRLPNAYLFEGPSGVGKQCAALGLALARLCPDKPGKGCGRCGVCNRIAAGLHPDVRCFAPREEGSRNIQVEFVRTEILKVAQFAPFEGAAALLLFPEADVSFPDQHPEAANALLKSLEEPRPNVCFVLLSERPDRLLVTIRSRCQRVRFGRLPELVLNHVLESHGIVQEQAEAALALADGRADRALELARDGLAGSLIERALRVDQNLSAHIPGRLVQLSEELAKADDCLLVLDTLAVLYRDVAASALGLPRASLRLPSAHATSAALAQSLGAQRAARRAQKIAELPELVARNANLQIALDHLLLELRH
jgi:DNA polymerase-3 subunit delta'